MTALPDPDRQPEFYESVPVRRLIAWVVDVVLISLLLLVTLPFTAFTGLFFLAPLYALLGFGYRVVTLAGASATLGMRFSGIELRTAPGHRFDIGAAILHTLGYYVSVAVAPLQLISVVMMAVSARGQGLTDAVLGTVALRKRAR